MLAADIREAKKKADHVIPFFHWGRESARASPSRTRSSWRTSPIDSGASAVLGSHPHVLQGIEVYQGAPIVYSLGNFVFGGNWDPKDKRTALVELKLTRTALKAIKVIPAYSDAFPEVPVQPWLAEGEKADAVLGYLASLSRAFPATIPQLKNIKPAPDDVRPDAGPGFPPDGGN